MSGLTGDEIIAMVRTTFDVVDVQRDSDMIRLRISDTEIKDDFVVLAQRLEELNILCQVQKKHDGMYVIIRRMTVRKGRRFLSSSWVPRMLFALVVGLVMVDGHYRTVETNQIVHIGDPMAMAAIYTVALLGILGIHELGHMIASKIHGIKASWPYFIPGMPVFAIPTFGALIMAKGLIINRKKMFDVAMAGPIAGLVIAIVVTIYAAATAPVLDPSLQEHLYETNQLTDWMFGEPLLMTASLALFDKGGQNGEVLMTPLLFASWLGLFLTFANLMPAGQLDGGHMIRTILGGKMLRMFTYVSAGVFILMNFWIVALLVLFMGMRGSGVTIMDDVTTVSARRKIVYIGMMAVAVLCAPIPDSLPTVIEPLLHLTQ